MVSKRIKFLVISSAYPYRGGISDSTHSFCDELIKNEISTEVWTFKKLYPNFLFPGKSQFTKEKINQTFTIKRKLNTLSPINWINVAKNINKLNPEILILRYWSPILCIPYFFISTLLKKKIRVIGLVDNWNNHEKILFENVLRNLFLSVCIKFISLSDNISNKIKQNTSKEVLTLFHPINNNLPGFKEKIQAKKDLNLGDFKYISFVGLIRKYKGVDTFIKSIRFIKNKSLKYIIAGEFYDSIDYYKKIIDENNLNDKIIIENDYLDSKRIRDYICASEIIIQPYKKASQSGITPLAYYYNKPLVVSNVKGLKEIIDKDQSGEIFDKTPNNLSKAILRCLEKEKYEIYITNILKAKSKYSWSAFIERIKAI